MDLKEVVQEKYGEAALRVRLGGSSCCGAAAALENCCDPITSNLYDATQTGSLPEDAVLASLGCGNPTALAELKAGETVLDLGSGGGIDVLLSARRASVLRAKPTASMMTFDEMLSTWRGITSSKPGSKMSNFSKAKLNTSRCLIIRSM